MKKFATLMMMLAVVPCLLMAQAKKTGQAPAQSCLFEKIFSAKPGMDMPAAIAVLSQYSRISLIDESSEKLKPYANTGGDSILHQTLTYRIDSTECLKGRNSIVKFEFADGRLYKAYIETIFLSHEYTDLMTNFDFLHKQILKSWKIEKQITTGGNSSEGFGYNFYKTLNKNVKLDMCMLQYVKDKGSVPSNDKYHLEILWANLNNTRMENSMY